MPLNALRYGAFGFVALNNAIIFILSLGNLVQPTVVGNYSQINRYLVTISPISVVFISTVSLIDIRRRGAFTSQVRFEIAWLFTFWILELAGAAAVTAQNPPVPHCIFQGEHYSWNICKANVALMVLTWMNTITLLAALLVLLIGAIIISEKFPQVWTMGAGDVAWFAMPSSLPNPTIPKQPRGSNDTIDLEKNKIRKPSPTPSRPLSRFWRPRPDLPIAALYESPTRSTMPDFPMPPPLPPKPHPPPAAQRSPNRSRRLVDAAVPHPELSFYPNYFQAGLAYEPPRTPSPESRAVRYDQPSSAGRSHHASSSNQHQPSQSRQPSLETRPDYPHTTQAYEQPESNQDPRRRERELALGDGKGRGRYSFYTPNMVSQSQIPVRAYAGGSASTSVVVGDGAGVEMAKPRHARFEGPGWRV